MFMNKTKNGFTMIELVIAIAILGTSLISILAIFRLVNINSSDPMIRMQATMIADSLMEEVLSKNFTKPTGGFTGPFTPTNQSQFDTVTDYNGLVFSGITILNGTNIPNLSKYSATVTTSNIAIGGITSANAILVTVSVSGYNYTYNIDGYKINYD